MKRFIIRQVSLILVLVMLLALTGLTEVLPVEGLETQDIDMDGIVSDDLALDGELELELEGNGSDGLILPADDEAEGEITLDGVTLEGTVDGVLDDASAAGNTVDDNVLLDGVTEEASTGSLDGVTGEARGDAADNDALADGYIRRVLPGLDDTKVASNAPTNAGRRELAQRMLTCTVRLYDALKPRFEKIAAGQETSTVFEFDAKALGTSNHWWSPEELGLSSFQDSECDERIRTVEGIDIRALRDALFRDCVYDMYWYDRNSGFRYEYYYKTENGRRRVDTMTIWVCVSEDYAAEPFVVNGLPARINWAKNNINQTISDNMYKTDLDKLTAYANTICSYVEYNHPAADDDSVPYGDPWQLVFLFDGDPATKVVCEGYAKAFKYLCDLTYFAGNVECVTVSGMLYYSTGSGSHMWNSVRMPDGFCYLVDLTNCDAGDHCSFSLFLKGCSGNPGGPYYCGDLRFEFHPEMWDIYGRTSPWLIYNNLDYGVGVPIDYNPSWSDLQAQIDRAKSGDTITLAGDLTARPGNSALVFPAWKSLTLDLAGHTLNRGLTEERAEGYVLTARGDLTVKDSVGGGRITGGWNAGYGGGIFVDNGAKVELAGGKITGNHALYGGGIGASGVGVYITDGVVSDNVAEYSGGGVALNAGYLEMTGGKISDNNSKNKGGGVWLSGDAHFMLKDGEVNGNTAVEFGGGVCIENANYVYSLKIDGGRLKDNTARVGGGVYDAWGTVQLISGSISRNTGEVGGGVCVYFGILEMISGELCGNKAKNGGGAWISEQSTFYLKGGELGGNTAEAYGGGAFMNGVKGNSQLLMEQGAIQDNTAESGGGVFLNSCIMEMSAGEVSRNKATNGGGIALSSASTFVMKGGELSGNSAKTYGGAICDLNATGNRVFQEGGSINGNSAEAGGGLFINDTGLFQIKGGEVCANEATARDGGGVCSAKGSRAEILGGRIFDNQVGSGHYGGGGYFYGTLLISGAPAIVNNHSGSKDDNCYLAYGENGNQRIYLADSLTQGACIGVTDGMAASRGNASYVFTRGLGANGNIGAFFSDDPNYTVMWSENGQEARLVKKGTPTDPTEPPQPTKTPQPTKSPQPTAKIKLSRCKFTVKKQVLYTGKAIKPAVTVKYGQKKLKKNTDYTVSYKNNKAVGAATVTVTGKGKYTGTKKLTFKIMPRSTAIKLSSAKEGVTVKWTKRSEATGYQVQYGLKSSFSGAKTVNVAKGKTGVLLKSLKAKKKYYVRVRVCSKAGKKTYYSAWSKAKSFEVK